MHVYQLLVENEFLACFWLSSSISTGRIKHFCRTWIVSITKTDIHFLVLFENSPFGSIYCESNIFWGGFWTVLERFHHNCRKADGHSRSHKYCEYFDVSLQQCRSNWSDDWKETQMWRIMRTYLACSALDSFNQGGVQPWPHQAIVPEAPSMLCLQRQCSAWVVFQCNTSYCITSGTHKSKLITVRMKEEKERNHVAECR